MTDFNRFASVFCGRGLKGGLRRGIERETLRVTPDGHLATTPHPRSLGSPLTHPLITTDFGEAQPEMITGVYQSAQACLDELRAIHAFMIRNIGDELLWPASMPCMLVDPDNIEIAKFGSTNEAAVKTIYRRGLAERYGPLMQIISGIHYNVSLADDVWEELAKLEGAANDRKFRDRRYLDLIRNFNRHSWLLIYLLGASPSLCSSFIKTGGVGNLKKWDYGTYYLPHATSLRMGPLGYQSDAQRSLYFSFNDLGGYASQILDAMKTPHGEFEALGMRDQSGDYLQLSTGVLQFEAEYYGTVRPKRSMASGERPLAAILEQGIEYVEMRCIDLDPFEELGISLEAIEFLDLFAMHCLVSESAPDSPEDIAEANENQQRTVHRGREPGLLLERNGQEIALRDWATEIVEEIAELASSLDFYCGGATHRTAKAFLDRVKDPLLLPSTRVLEEMRSERVTFFRFAMNLAERYREGLLAEEMDLSEQRRIEDLATSSLAEWERREAVPRVAFEEHLKRFMGQVA